MIVPKSERTQARISAPSLDGLAGPSSKPYLAALLLGLILLGAFFIRFDSLFFWLDHKERFFFDQQRTPLTLTVDAYYYLDIAKELRAGNYQAFDPRRRAPLGLTRVSTPPLISVLLAGLAEISGLSLEMIAILLPALWGALTGLPVYLFAERMFRRPGAVDQGPWLSASQIAGLTAAALTLVAPKLVVRTSIGWFDTDGLNMFFSVSAVYLALRLFQAEERRGQLFWLIAGCVNLVLFLWNWDQAPVGALALGGSPLLIAVLLLVAHKPKALLPLLVPGLLMLGLLVSWKGMDVVNPVHLWQTLANYLDYFTNRVAPDSPFPDTGHTVSEQSGAALGEIFIQVAGNVWVWCAALLGVLWLVRFRPKAALLLLPLLLVSLLAFTAKRFELFMSPLVGFGLAAFAYLLCRLNGPTWTKPLLFALVLGLSSWQSLLKDNGNNRIVPRRAPVLFEALRQLERDSPEDSLIWANWGHGHPLVYYTDRATLADGIWHPASISYVTDFPLTVHDFRLAANWMQFYAAHGMPGLERINRQLGNSAQDWAQAMPRFRALLAAGPQGARDQLLKLPTEKREELLQFIFPQNSRPVILFLEYLHAYTDWYSNGAWDFEKRSSPPAGMYLPLEAVKQDGNRAFKAASKVGRVRLDKQQGILDVAKKAVPLKRLDIYSDHMDRYVYRRRSAIVARLNARSATGIGGESDQVDSVFSSLFYLQTSDPKYFTPFRLKPPYYGLWWVRGEAYSPP